jgi:hypothetical protein
MAKSSAKRLKIIDILDEDELYRRIHPNWKKNNGRISSGAFKTKTPPLSVDVAKLTTPEKSLSNCSNYWLASIVTKLVRSLELDARHEPKLENYAHGIIEGNITPSKAKRLASNATTVIK